MNDLKKAIVDYCTDCGLDTSYGIDETLKELIETEPLMYWRIKRYRDHFIHSCRVALLGLYLLDKTFEKPSESSCCLDKSDNDRFTKSIKKGRYFWQWVYELLPDEMVCSVVDEDKTQNLKRCKGCHIKKYQLYDGTSSFCVTKPLPSKSKEEDCENYVKQLWLLTALKHDVGYSYTYVKELYNKNLLLQKDRSRTLRDIDSRMMGAFHDIFDIVKIHASTIDSAQHQTDTRKVGHGIIGALHVKGLRGDEYLVENAARAIAKHDDDTRDVCFDKEPLSWLLILVDELQEWGRPVHTSRSSDYKGGLGLLALNLLARNELDALGVSLDQKAGDIISRIVFTMDYSDDHKQALLRDDTKFYFPFFTYQKQLNLSRLIGGPGVGLNINGGDLLKKQFSRFTKATMKNRFNLAEWIKQVSDLRYKSAFRFGWNSSAKKYDRICRPLDVFEDIAYMLENSGKKSEA